MPSETSASTGPAPKLFAARSTLTSCLEAAIDRILDEMGDFTVRGTASTAGRVDGSA
jgi:hypothetical protein